MGDKLVTVVTATWRRHDTLLRLCIPSVARQTYRPIEHLIISDGPDSVLKEEVVEMLEGTRRLTNPLDRHPQRLRFIDLGRNWTGFSADGGQGAVPRLVGSYLAAGDYVTYLDDDNELLAHHVETMVRRLEETGSDFVTTRWIHGINGCPGGGTPPGPGLADTSGILSTADCLRRFGTWERDGYTGDGKLVTRWIERGAKWAHVDEPTFTLHAQRFGAPD